MKRSKVLQKSFHWVNECRRLQSTKLALLKIPNLDDIALRQIIDRIPSSRIGTLAHFRLIVSLCFQLIHLPLSILNQVTCLASSG